MDFRTAIKPLELRLRAAVGSAERLAVAREVLTGSRALALSAMAADITNGTLRRTDVVRALELDDVAATLDHLIEAHVTAAIERRTVLVDVPGVKGNALVIGTPDEREPRRRDHQIVVGTERIVELDVTGNRYRIVGGTGGWQPGSLHDDHIDRGFSNICGRDRGGITELLVPAPVEVGQIKRRAKARIVGVMDGDPAPLLVKGKRSRFIAETPDCVILCLRLDRDSSGWMQQDGGPRRAVTGVTVHRMATSASGVWLSAEGQRPSRVTRIIRLGRS